MQFPLPPVSDDDAATEALECSVAGEVSRFVVERRGPSAQGAIQSTRVL